MGEERSRDEKDFWLPFQALETSWRYLKRGSKLFTCVFVIKSPLLKLTRWVSDPLSEFFFKIPAPTSLSSF